MFLRRPSCRITTTGEAFASPRCATRLNGRLRSDARLKSDHPNPSRSGYDARNTHAKRSAIRPITLFAACIPLGYALSYALTTRDAGVERDGFVKYELVRKEDVSTTSSIFTLRPLSDSATLRRDDFLSHAITSVQFKQPQLQIARSYTLLPPLQGQSADELRFLIRKERNGEVSGYLHRLPIGSVLELRGLSAEYILPNDVDKVVFIAGGTGIAPAMQVATAFAGKVDMHVLWASRQREECDGGSNDTVHRSDGVYTKMKAFLGLSEPKSNSTVEMQGLLVAQLEQIKRASVAEAGNQGSGLKVDYYVDDEGTFIQASHVQRLLQHTGPLDDGGLRNFLFVAGPDGFVTHWAGSKLWVNGEEVQGPVGGMLSRMDLAGWEVVKL